MEEVDMYGLGYGYSYYRMLDSLSTVLVVSLIIFAIVGILMMALFLPMKKAGRYKGFARTLYDFFNFNSFWISPIIKVLYITISGTCLVCGIYMLFAGSINGLLILALGIVVRLFFEMTMLFLNMRDQLSKINWYLGKLTDDKDTVLPSRQPDLGAFGQRLEDKFGSMNTWPNQPANPAAAPNQMPPQASPAQEAVQNTPPVQTEQQSAARICQHCGAPITADHVFCKKCGNKTV